MMWAQEKQRRLSSILQRCDTARSRNTQSPSTGFIQLELRNCLGLVLDLIEDDDALCVALVCKAFCAAVFQRYPVREDGWRLTTGVSAVAASVSRLVWARDLTGTRTGRSRDGGLEIQGPPWLTAWDTSTCAALARANQLHALQWARAGGGLLLPPPSPSGTLLLHKLVQRQSAGPTEELVVFAKKRRQDWIAWHEVQNLRKGLDPRKYSNSVLERFRAYADSDAQDRQRQRTDTDDDSYSCPWDETVCSEAARGGHLEVLKWARAAGCAWDHLTCWWAARNGHEEVLHWARAHGCTLTGDRAGGGRHCPRTENGPYLIKHA